MNDVSIHAEAREMLGKKTRTLRTAGQLPAVVYGSGEANKNIIVHRNEFQRVLKEAGESTLVNLAIGTAAPVKVLIQDVQRHPVTGAVQHVDFYQVRMTEKISAKIPFEFIGEAPAVKELGGVLVKSLDEVEIKALPGDLVHEIVIDVSSLKTFDDIIRIKDVVFPKGIEPEVDAEEAVCLVTPPRSEAELADLESKVEEKVDAVEGVKKEEAAADGDAPAATEEKKDQ